MTNKELAIKSAVLLDSKKASDVTILDISDKSGFADYFVIGTGISERQVAALSDYISDELAASKVYPKSIEGKAESGWILMDFGDIIINLFLNEQREKYNLEKVWADCKRIAFEG